MKGLSETLELQLDNGLLAELYEGDEEQMLVIFEQFLGTTPALMQEAEICYHDGEVELFRQKVHKLKPVFSFIGLPSITDQAEFLEKRCKQISVVEEVSALFDDLKAKYLKGVEIVQKEINRINAI